MSRSTLQAGLTAYAVLGIHWLSAPCAQPALSPFAASMSHSSMMNAQAWVAPISAAGVRWVRGFYSTGNVSTAQGIYDWTACDTYVQRCTDNNLNIVAIVNGVPGWISSELEFPVRDLSGYAEVITAMVNRYKDRVKYWEVWNEPPNFCHTDSCTVENYARTVVAVYDAAKAADPDCKVGLAAKSNFTSWLEHAIRAGAADHFDFISLHPYEILGTSVGSNAEAHFMGIVPAVRTLLRQHNPAKENVPILFTEIGTPIGETMGADSITEDRQAHVVLKTYTMSIAQGVAGVFWFEVRDGDSGPFGLITGSRQRPSYAALKTMIDHMGQNPDYLGWVLLQGEHYGFVFQGPTETVLIAWARHGVSDTVSFGQAVQLIDPLTAATSSAHSAVLTDAPIMVINPPQSLITQATANHGQPFPWNGDYTGVATATATMGQPNDERGVHQLNPDIKSTYTDSPYGPARFCGVSRDQIFLVDPNFLLYTTTPITITATMRRNESNENAGFNLWYESTTWSDTRKTNFKSTGSWYTIPGNDQWYTKSWTIDDAQFTGMWGYNFWFQSDGTQYSQYYLQSVSVTIDGATTRWTPSAQAQATVLPAAQAQLFDLAGRRVVLQAPTHQVSPAVYLVAGSKHVHITAPTR